MAWIKKNPHLVTLIIIALSVAAASGMLVMNTQNFAEKFSGVQQPVVKGTKTYQQEQKDIDAAKAEFQQPAAWTTTDKSGSLFVSARYMVSSEDSTKLTTPEKGTRNKDSLTKKGIPNEWFLNNKLPLFAPDVARQDPDNDGFFNEDEYRGNTEPSNPKSHPPYYTKLFVKKYIRVPFLLKFQSYDGDPKKDKPEDMQFQINTLSLRQPTLFLKVGDMVPKTNFKIQGFEYKMIVNENQTEVDTSTLTILDTETNTPLNLIYNTVVDSPDSYALFSYIFPKPAKDIQVKKLKEFVLVPETTQRYKLLDIDDKQALIQTPSGEKVSIPYLPAGYP